MFLPLSKNMYFILKNEHFEKKKVVEIIKKQGKTALQHVFPAFL